jgi:hypothetical protein
MHRSFVSACVALAAVALWCPGCASEDVPTARTGFLQTYSNLEQVSPTSWRYLDPNNRLARYDKFYIEPIQVIVPEGARGQETRMGAFNEAKAYMRQTLIDSLEPVYEVVETAGPDVADVRVALTDGYIKDNRVGIAVEFELLDSVSQYQIAALVETQRGPNLTISDFWKRQDAKTIMDNWAQRFRTVVDDAHGR